jgi:hypothetical protein
MFSSGVIEHPLTPELRTYLRHEASWATSICCLVITALLAGAALAGAHILGSWLPAVGVSAVIAGPGCNLFRLDDVQRPP